MTPLFALLLLQVATDPPRGQIAGRIVAAETGEPLAGANLQAQASVHEEKHIWYATSGADGAFRFGGLAKGEYLVSARKSGYQAETRFPQAVKLDPQQRQTELVFRFHRSGVISGRVTDSGGEPAIGARITAYRVFWEDGRRRLSEAAGATADDRGRYRLFALAAGRYLVAASGPAEAGGPGDLAAAARTYFPSGARPSEAAPVLVRWGAEAGETNLTLLQEPGYTVSGSVTDAQSAGPCHGCTLSAARLDDLDDLGLRQFGVASDGSYRLRGLAPGVYRISVETVSPRGGHLVSSRTITIDDRNVSGANLLAGVDRAITGRLLLESPPSELDPGRRPPYVEARDAGAGALVGGARAGSGLAFEIRGLASLPYRFRARVPGGYLQELRLGGQPLAVPEVEIPEEGSLTDLEAVIAFDGGTVSGSVRPPEGAGEGHRVTAASVVLWPEAGQSAYLTEQSAGTDSSGAFRLEAITPGAYTAFAIPVEQPPPVADPEVRRRLASYGRAVRVEGSGRVTVELPLAPSLEDLP